MGTKAKDFVAEHLTKILVAALILLLTMYFTSTNGRVAKAEEKATQVEASLGSVKHDVDSIKVNIQQDVTDIKNYVAQIAADVDRISDKTIAQEKEIEFNKREHKAINNRIEKVENRP